MVNFSFLTFILISLISTKVFAEKVCVEYKDNSSVFAFFQENKCAKKVDKKYAKCDSWSSPFWGENECESYKERTVCMNYTRIGGKSICSKEIPTIDYEKLPMAEALPTFENDPEAAKEMAEIKEYATKNQKIVSEKLGDHETLNDKITHEIDEGVIPMENGLAVCCSGGICRFSSEALSCNLTEGTIFDDTGEQNSELGNVLSIISMQTESDLGSSFRGFADLDQCESCYRRVFNTQKKVEYEDAKDSLIKKLKRDLAEDHLNKLLLNAGILKNYYDLHEDKFYEIKMDELGKKKIIGSFETQLNNVYPVAIQKGGISAPSSPAISSISGKERDNLFQCLPFKRLESEASKINENCSQQLDGFLKSYGTKNTVGKNRYDLSFGGPRRLGEATSHGDLYDKNLKNALEKRSEDLRSQIDLDRSALEVDEYYLSMPSVLIRHNSEFKEVCEQVEESIVGSDIFNYASKLFSLKMIAINEGRVELDGSELLKMEKLMLLDPNLGIHFNNANVFCDTLNKYGNDFEGLSRVDFKEKIHKNGLINFDKKGKVYDEVAGLADSLCMQQANKILTTLCLEKDDSELIQDNLDQIDPDKLKLSSGEKLILAEESCKKRLEKRQHGSDRSILQVDSLREKNSSRLRAVMKKFDQESTEVDLGNAIKSSKEGLDTTTVKRSNSIKEDIKNIVEAGSGNAGKGNDPVARNSVNKPKLETDDSRPTPAGDLISAPLKQQVDTVVEDVVTDESFGSDPITTEEEAETKDSFAKMYTNMIENSNQLVKQNPMSKGKSVQEMLDSGEIEKPSPSDLQNAMAEDSELGEQFVDVSGKLSGKLKDGVDPVDELEDYLVNNGDNLEDALKDDLEPSEKEKLLKEIEDLKAAAVVSAIEKKHSEKVKTMESRIKDLESELAGFKKIQAAGVSTNSRSNESNRVPSNIGVNGSRTAGLSTGIAKNNGNGGGSDYNAGNGLSSGLKSLSPEERARYLSPIKKIPKSVIENPEQFSISLTYDKKQSRALLVIPKAGLTTEGEYALYPDQIKVDNIENPTVVMLGSIKRAIPISQLSKESRETVFNLVKLQTKNKIIKKQDLVNQELSIARELLESEKKIADRYSVFKNCLKNPTDKVCK